MAYTPANGDRVTVTRTWPDGRRGHWTGVISEITTDEEAEQGTLGFGGFRIAGTGSGGQPVDTYLADAVGMWHYYSVVQTIEPAPDA